MLVQAVIWGGGGCFVFWNRRHLEIPCWQFRFVRRHHGVRFPPCFLSNIQMCAQSMPSTGFPHRPSIQPEGRLTRALNGPGWIPLWCRQRLTLAHAKVKGMHALAATAHPPRYHLQSKGFTQTNKESKSSGSGGGWLLLTAPLFCLSRYVSPSLCLFSPAPLTMSGLSGVVRSMPPLMECYYVFPLSVWPEADCTYFPWSCVHPSLTFICFYRAFVCACVCLCTWTCVFLFLSNIMPGIRSATQAPELLLPPNAGFQQYLANSSRYCRLVWH